MPITTKTGDKGITYLYCGARVAKDHISLEVCGNLDELCSCLGLSKSLIKQNSVKKMIESVQKDLFIIGAELATRKEFIGKLKTRVDKTDVDRLEKILVDLENARTFQERCFYLPGVNPVSSSLDIARTVARRVERSVVTLKRKRLLSNKFILIYLNRLSDLLYLLARRHEKKHVKLTLEEAR
jgi:cob(I)alamin adenosyltransferase